MTRRTHFSPLALLAVIATACGSPVETITPPPPPPPGLNGPAPFVVSNSVAIGSAGSNVVQGSSGSHPVAFVSLVPGTLPGVTVVRIRVHRNGVVVPAALVDGGLDPVAVPAIAGDSITVTATGVDGLELRFGFVVPSRKPPVIIRTEPKKNKRDVAINVQIQVVFSEPIDFASLTPQNFELRSGSGVVAGQLGFANPEHTIVEFTPAEDLAGATDYELVLRPGIRDTDGTPLEAVVNVPFTTAEAPPGALGFGSVTGVYRGSGSGYPVNGNGLPSEAANWWRIPIVAAAPGLSSRVAWGEKNGPGSFEFEGLAAGEWTLLFTGMHPWSEIFPAMRLYADTVISVTVLPNQTVIVPEMVLRPVEPFMVIAIYSCPYRFSSPPTAQDWGECDGGHGQWGGVDAAVEVQGIAGTATAGVRYSLFIPSDRIPSDRWRHVELHDIPLGEYEVSLVPVDTKWRLLPWQSSPVRLRVDRGLAYVEFDYWYQR